MYVSSAATFEHTIQQFHSHSFANAKDWFGKVVVFFQREAVDRASFLEPAVESLINTVGSVATTALRALWSATAGLFFTDKTLRDYAWASAKDVGTSLNILVSSAAGVVLCPAAAERVHKEINKL